AAVFHSGNQTTTVNEGAVCNGGASAGPCTVNGVTYPGGLPAPNQDANRVTGPETGLLLTVNRPHWTATLGRNRDNAVSLTPPDRHGRREPLDTARHGGDRRRQHALRGGLRLERSGKPGNRRPGGRVCYRAAGGQYVHAESREPHPAERRRRERPHPQRGETA